MISLNSIASNEDFTLNSEMDIDDDDLQSYTKTAKVGSKDCTLMKLGKLLLLKSKQGNAEEVRRLMSIGAPFTANMVGTSPLHWAVHYNHMEVTELLLKAGIARDARNKVDRTPCHIAANKGFHSVLRLLLAYGADVNCKDMLRMTPLHWAAESGSVPCIQLLLNYGCDINCINKFDKTALEIAIENNHLEAARLIETTLKEDPKVRMTKVTHFKDGNKIIAIKNSKVVDIESSIKINFTDPPEKKNRIGLFLTKPDPVTGIQSTIELINDEPIQDTKKKVLPKQYPENKRTPLVVTDDGKVVLNSPKSKILLKDSKIVTKPKLVPVNAPKPVSLSMNNSKRIIKVDAAQLINMTKEKKFCIKPPKPRMSQITENTIQVPKTLHSNNGKLHGIIQVPKFLHCTNTIQISKSPYSNTEKTTQVPKINNEESIKASLQTAIKEADELRKLLIAKEKEIDNYKRQLQNQSGLT